MWPCSPCAGASPWRCARLHQPGLDPELSQPQALVGLELDLGTRQQRVVVAARVLQEVRRRAPARASARSPPAARGPRCRARPCTGWARRRARPTRCGARPSPWRACARSRPAGPATRRRARTRPSTRFSIRASRFRRTLIRSSPWLARSGGRGALRDWPRARARILVLATTSDSRAPARAGPAGRSRAAAGGLGIGAGRRGRLRRASTATDDRHDRHGERSRWRPLGAVPDAPRSPAASAGRPDHRARSARGRGAARRIMPEDDRRGAPARRRRAGPPGSRRGATTSAGGSRSRTPPAVAAPRRDPPGETPARSRSPPDEVGARTRGRPGLARSRGVRAASSAISAGDGGERADRRRAGRRQNGQGESSGFETRSRAGRREQRAEDQGESGQAEGRRPARRGPGPGADERRELRGIERSRDRQLARPSGARDGALVVELEREARSSTAVELGRARGGCAGRGRRQASIWATSGWGRSGR